MSEESELENELDEVMKLLGFDLIKVIITLEALVNMVGELEARVKRLEDEVYGGKV